MEKPGSPNSSHSIKGFGVRVQHRFRVALKLLPLKLMLSCLAQLLSEASEAEEGLNRT